QKLVAERAGKPAACIFQRLPDDVATQPEHGRYRKGENCLDHTFGDRAAEVENEFAQRTGIGTDDFLNFAARELRPYLLEPCSDERYADDPGRKVGFCLKDLLRLVRHFR